MKRYTATCDCGYNSTRRTQGLADYSLRRHSCDAQRVRQERQARVEARRSASGVEAPCQHGGKHAHGDRVRYVIDKCRCRVCRDAATRYNAERRRQNLYGNPAYVDSTPARQHVQTLQAWGMGWKRIARSAGLSESVVWKLIYGDPSRNLAPSKRVRVGTLQAILAVELDLAGGALVEATGTRRRLQALGALGWTVQALAERAGVDRQRIDKALRGSPYVTVATEAATRTLYDHLWNEHPEGGRSEATRRRAARLGWAPPLAWDDDTIDDPAARPDLGERTRGVDLDEVLYLLGAGETPEQAARRCGVRLEAVEASARRHGRDDVLDALALARRAAA